MVIKKFVVRLAIVTLFTVSVGAPVVMSQGCALSHTSTPGSTPEEQRLNELGAVVATSVNVVKVARAAQDLEIKLHNEKVITDEQHITYQTAFKTFFDAASTAFDQVQNVATPEATRKDLAMTIIHAANALVTTIKGGHAGVDGVLLAIEVMIRVFL